MKAIKCECGHENPYGTEFCAACGKPFKGGDSDQLINMRYEGSAIRSKTYNKTIIDKIWNFFSSVKVGVTIIFIILVAAAIGSIFPQQEYIPSNADPATYYEDRYGIFGKIYYLLGFENLYGSWWFITLLATLGLSIIVASIDRGVPLYKSLKNQRVTRHENFLKGQRLVSITPGSIPFEHIKGALIKNRYKVREENGNILAEKGRFSRWGAYVNHTGLIIFLVGAMLRFFPGMYIDKVVWIKEGETAAIPGTNNEYYLKNNNFILQTYSKNDKQYKAALQKAGEVPKNYESKITLYRAKSKPVIGELPKLEKIKDGQAKVNHPFKFSHYGIYQSYYRQGELDKMKFNLVNKKTGKAYGPMTVDLNNPKTEYDLGHGVEVKLSRYYPNFYFDEKGLPASRNKSPENPAFVFDFKTPETPDGERSLVAIQQTIEANKQQANKYKMKFAGVEMKDVSGLTVKKDLTLPIIIVGATIFMLGVVQGLYWNHRRIWIRQKDNETWLAAHTNKNWFGFKKEIQKISDETGLIMPVDKVEPKRS